MCLIGERLRFPSPPPKHQVRPDPRFLIALGKGTLSLCILGRVFFGCFAISAHQISNVVLREASNFQANIPISTKRGQTFPGNKGISQVQTAYGAKSQVEAQITPPNHSNQRGTCFSCGPGGPNRGCPGQAGTCRRASPDSAAAISPSSGGFPQFAPFSRRTLFQFPFSPSSCNWHSARNDDKR